MDDLMQAKMEVIASFARGQGIMIDDDDVRYARLAGLLAVIEVEFESEQATVTPIASRRRATISPIHVQELHASNTQLDWSALISQLRSHPGQSKHLSYDKYRTAVVTASRQRGKFKDIDFEVEHSGGEGGVVICTAR